MNFRYLIKPLIVIVVILLQVTAVAQTIGGGIYFQAIARDNMSNPAKDRKIYIQTSIRQYSETGIIVLTEEFETKTDAFGVFGISIGLGKRMGGEKTNLNSIEWSKGPYFLNLRIAISPVAPIINWDYSKDWIDLGSTSFGTVPYALYAGSSGALDSKLNIADTTKMLSLYAKAQAVQSLSTAIATKIATSDTSAMLAPYKQIINSLIISNTTSTNTNKVKEALDTKLNIADSNSIYITPTLLNLSKMDTSNLSNRILKSLKIEDSSNMLKPYAKLNDVFKGNYDSLYNTPTLFDGEYSSLLHPPSLFDGNYNTLNNKPVLFNGDYISLANKPLLFSGNYNDLSNTPTLSLTGDITNIGSATTLLVTGVNAGTYGNGLSIPTITIDSKGRITAASNINITPNSFPNKTNAEKNVLTNTAATGTLIWCSDCGTRGQMQVYNGYEWTDLIGGPALINGIILNAITINTITSSNASTTVNISSDGGASITAKGIVWSTSVHPTISLATKTNDGIGITTYSSTANTLSASTVYYIRAYATNANGTVYGNELSFTTAGILPTITTTAASAITINGFTTGGNISNDGGNIVTYRGICWSTITNPSTNDNKILNGTGLGIFAITISGLNANTTYYARSFATNSTGTSYGNQITITTSTLDAGTSYLGGKIAYIFAAADPGYISGETHGFIIMNHKMGMQSPYGGYNSGTGNFIYSNTSMSFGTGMANTLKLYNLSGNNAAKNIYNISYDGYSDWYIPSYAEWNKIASNWSRLGLLDGNYQSSSETDLYNNFYEYIYTQYGYLTTGITNSGKTSLYDIIGIRNF